MAMRSHAKRTSLLRWLSSVSSFTSDSRRAVDCLRGRRFRKRTRSALLQLRDIRQLAAGSKAMRCGIHLPERLGRDVHGIGRQAGFEHPGIQPELLLQLGIALDQVRRAGRRGNARWSAAGRRGGRSNP